VSRARDLANYGDGIDTSSITSGTFADARIAQSNVTQHESAIDALGTVTSGTFNGTIGSSATIPASVGGGTKLTGSYSGVLNGASITYFSHGAFTSTYDTYLVIMKGVLTNDSATDSHLQIRLTKSNSTMASDSYYSNVHGTDKNGNTNGFARNNNDSIYLIDGVDANNHWSAQFYVYTPATSTHTWMSGTASYFRNNDNCAEQSFTGFHGSNYSATGFGAYWDNSAASCNATVKIYGITTS
tara:strand:- start:1212 stop:1937 length:726 start_codon:yes stop_codon:yes gene_type:complete